jgi:protein-tyrosine phosphatase
MDYARILPELWVGSHPRGADDVERLKQEAVTAVLSLQTDEDLRYLDVDWGALSMAYTALGIQVRRVPVRDFDAADLRARLGTSVRALHQLLEAPRAVYLHCTAGTGRAPAVAIAYLQWVRGWGLDEAVGYVTHRRPCAPNIDAVRAAMHDLLSDQIVRHDIERRAYELFARRSPETASALDDWVQAERQVLRELFRTGTQTGGTASDEGSRSGGS